MSKLAPARLLVCVLAGCALLSSCSNPQTTQVINNPIPASVSISPAPNASIEVGKTVSFTASARNGAGKAVPETFTYQSSNPSILTVSTSGIACAGTWDSLSSPTLCAPGGTGVAQLTAVANGVSSPPVTVYVHQHVTKVVIQKVPNQPATLISSCFSRNVNHQGPEKVLYEGIAYGQGPGGANIDLTSSVGQFFWSAVAVANQSTNSQAVTLSSPGSAAPLNQQIATANMPGTTSIAASVGGVVSQPTQFTTCPVQSIQLQLGPGSSLAIGTASSATVNAIVTDTVGMDLTGIPLIWASSHPQAVPVSGATSTVFGSVGTVTGSAAGTAAITASCTPPSCNGGFLPSTPIYPATALSFQVTSSLTPPSTTTYVTTSACGATTLACTTRIVPITRNTTTGVFSAGATLNLPSTPNSFSLGAAGGTSYLGVDSVGFNSLGVMAFTGSAISQAPGVAGRVLAVSPDSQTVILSDTIDSPSRVNICKGCAANGRTVTPIFLPNATAAAFSPDGFKAYIVFGGSCPGTSSNGCLLVYSQVDAPQFVSLSAAPTDVAFIGNGTAGYVAQGVQPGATTLLLPTCDAPNAAGSIGTVNLQSEHLRPLPDGMSLLSLAPPSIRTLTATITGTATPLNPSGCFDPVNITNTPGPSLNLGLGAFTPQQFFLSPDGSSAYILAQNGTGSYLPFVIKFDVATGVSSQVSLAGGAIPLRAGASRAGDVLFVGANDSSVHVIDTATGLDIQQVPLTLSNNSSLCIGPGNPATQVDIAALTISAAQQSAPPSTNTTFTYNISNGSTPQVGQTLVVSGMADGGNNGTFTILAVNVASSSSGTVTVSNAAGVSASGQSGTATVPLSCNPDLLLTMP